MAVARRVYELSGKLLRNKVYLYSAARCYSDTREPWNYLWKPGKYSPKDHDKIADKYQMHPKEYKPYSPEANEFLGDYPQLPMVGPAAKDPYYPYDIPIFKKNYHETLHDKFEIMGEDRYSYGYKYIIDLGLATVICISVFFGLYGIYLLLEPFPTIHPRMAQQFPGKGKIHYTFEPADS